VLADESTVMLDSDSRYLPVLSGSSSPLVHSEPKPAATKPRRVVANFAFQSASSVKHSDVILHPTKSTSQPTTRSTAVHRHSRSPVARTLDLDSSNSLVTAIGNNSVNVKLHPSTNITRNPSHQLCIKSGIVSALSPVNRAGNVTEKLFMVGFPKIDD